MTTTTVPSERSPAAGPTGGLASSTRRRRPSPRTVLAIASLGAAVAFVDATIVNIAFPDIARSFKGTSISSLSWVLNAYNIVFAAFLVAAGRIADLLGRRRIFVLGLEVFTGASLLCAVAPSADALVAFRVVQALGAALLVPAALALVMNAFPADRRSHGVALLSAVAAAAAGLGPSLGGLLVAAGGWRLVFLVNLPIGVTAIVLARRRLTESRTPAAGVYPISSAHCCSRWPSPRSCSASSRDSNGAGPTRAPSRRSQSPSSSAWCSYGAAHGTALHSSTFGCCGSARSARPTG